MQRPSSEPARDGSGSHRPSRPVHLRPAFWGVVWVGGTAGTAARYLLNRAVPPVAGVPLGTLTINVAGAFALGFLLEGLTRRGPDRGARRVLRLLLGTGFLGGFTTYSALAVDTDSLLRGGQVGHAIGYAGLTVLLGGAASLAGIALAARRRRDPAC